MQANELRKMGVDELREELTALQREAFNLQMQRGGDQLAKPHLCKRVRKNIARTKTILHEKVKNDE
ncbi:MAG: 50S ribosomal protein L29 [Gammaproteobacteria bacterium]